MERVARSGTPGRGRQDRAFDIVIVKVLHSREYPTVPPRQFDFVVMAEARAASISSVSFSKINPRGLDARITRIPLVSLRELCRHQSHAVSRRHVKGGCDFDRCRKNRLTVYVNKEQQTFATSRIKLIRISGGTGNDSIIVSPRLTIHCSIEGGPGNDRIGGSAANDTIFGESGNDTLVGNDGDDYIDAGPGDDLIDGGNGVNVEHGGSGSDTAAPRSPVLGSGIETTSDDFRLTADLARTGSTVQLHVSGPSLLGDVDDLEPLAALPDGRWNVTLRYVGVVNGANPPDAFSVSQDVTGVQRSGFYFSYVDAEDSSNSFSVPFLLPTH